MEVTMFTTSADVIRDMIREMAGTVREQGGDLIHGCSERIEALWMEIDHHLCAADLCELLGESDRVNGHLETINGLMGKILNELPE